MYYLKNIYNELLLTGIIQLPKRIHQIMRLFIYRRRFNN